METPDRDLSFGRGQVWEEVQIWDKKRDGVDIARLPTAEGTRFVENQYFAKKSSPKCRSRPEVSMPGLETSKYIFQDLKISKIIPRPEKSRIPNKKPVKGLR